MRRKSKAYGQLVISQEIVSDTSFFANKPYVNCLNGVVDVINGKLLEHSHKYRFKHCVNARFLPGSGCERFLKYVDTITAGDKELAELLQVFMGYLMSDYNNAKTAFLLFCVSNTGKSVLCEVLSKVVGDI